MGSITENFSLKRIINTLLCAALVAIALTVQANTNASNVSDFLHVKGSLRLYVFNKNYGAQIKQNKRSSVLGESVDITISPFLGGFGLGLSLYNTNAIETFGVGNKSQETTLMGAHSSLSTIGQAYAQYKLDSVLIRTGRQSIKTPWMSARNSRMIPQTYEGIWGQVSPIKGLTLMATRVNAFKSRASNSFYRDNLFYLNGYLGDTLYGRTKAFPNTAVLPEARGTLAAGASYAAGPIHAQAWHYNFYDFASTTYVDGGYTFGNKKEGLQTYLDTQFMKQTGGDYLVRFKAKRFGKGNSVNSNLFGVRGGVKFSGNNISLAYNKLQDNVNAFGGGAIVSPYGNYTAMFAGVMANNLSSYGPGTVTELAWKRTFLGKKLKIKAAVLKFHTTYEGNPHAVYLDAKYSFKNTLKGLSLRDRLAVSNGALSAASSSLVYNHVMLQYRF